MSLFIRYIIGSPFGTATQALITVFIRSQVVCLFVDGYGDHPSNIGTNLISNLFLTAAFQDRLAAFHDHVRLRVPEGDGLVNAAERLRFDTPANERCQLKHGYYKHRSHRIGFLCKTCRLSRNRRCTHRGIISQHPISGNSDNQEDGRETSRDPVVFKVNQNPTLSFVFEVFCGEPCYKKGSK